MNILIKIVKKSSLKGNGEFINQLNKSLKIWINEVTKIYHQGFFVPGASIVHFNAIKI